MARRPSVRFPLTTQTARMAAVPTERTGIAKPVLASSPVS